MTEIVCPQYIYINEIMECDVIVYGDGVDIQVDFGDGATSSSVTMAGKNLILHKVLFSHFM